VRHAARRRTLAIFFVLGVCFPGFPGSASAGQIYGDIRIRDLKTEKVRPVDARCKIEVITKHRRLWTLSDPAATYRMEIPEEGVFELRLHYRDKVLSTEIGSWYGPNRWDLEILKSDERYSLTRIHTNERRSPPDQDNPD
jgi:hypothetical protein